jgi:hypothetical protein
MVLTGGRHLPLKSKMEKEEKIKQETYERSKEEEELLELLEEIVWGCPIDPAEGGCDSCE